jgi:hypothetical protein
LEVLEISGKKKQKFYDDPEGVNPIKDDVTKKVLNEVMHPLTVGCFDFNKTIAFFLSNIEEMHQ